MISLYPPYILTFVCLIVCFISSNASSVSWLFWIRDKFCSSKSAKMSNNSWGCEKYNSKSYKKKSTDSLLKFYSFKLFAKSQINKKFIHYTWQYILNFEQRIFVEHQFLWILLILVHPQNQMSFERLPWVFLLLYHCQKTCLWYILENEYYEIQKNVNECVV